MFKKEVREKTALQKRVEKIPTHSLPTWAEQALYEIGRGLSYWIKSGDDAVLDDLEKGSKALLAVLSEMKLRANDVSR